MRQGLVLLTAPAVEPATLTEAKSYLGVLDPAEDALIGNLIAAARQAVESYTGRVLITQSWRLTLDNWPEPKVGVGSDLLGLQQDWPAQFVGNGGLVVVELPKAPLQSVSGVRVYDSSGVASTVAPSAYVVDTTTTPSRLVFGSNISLPAVGQVARGIEIDFVAGYGASATSLPAMLRQAVLAGVKVLYERSGDGAMSSALRLAELFKLKRI
jgi:hypothetical protein